jgi:hypothetical protein
MIMASLDWAGGCADFHTPGEQTNTSETSSDIGTPTLHFAGERGHGEHIAKSAVKQIAVIFGRQEVPGTKVLPPRVCAGAYPQKNVSVR